MIQSLQKFSQSKIAKIFLAVVALSFVAFFGGGNFFRPHDPTATIAEIGPLAISRFDFTQKVREQTQRIANETGENLTTEQLLESGLPQMVLNHMIQETLLNLEADNLGLVVSDETVVAQLQSIKAFHNESGQFDKNRFKQILKSMGHSEETFIEQMRQEIGRFQLSNAIMVGAYLSDDIVNHLFEAQYQKRQASQLNISPKDVPAPQPPSQEVLETFFKAHEQFFETPELRTISALILDPSSITKDIPVSDEEMKITYEAKAASFGNKPFDQVKDQVKADVQKEKALEEIYKVTQDLDDKIASGATFEELATQTKGAKLVKLESVTVSGSDPIGVPSPNLPQDTELAKDILQTAFGLDEATDSPFSQGKNGSYYTVRIDKITPKAIQPFVEIKERVLKVWTENEKLKAAQEKAMSYADSFNKGEQKASMMTLLPNLSRGEPNVEVSEEIQEIVFSLRPGKAGIAQTRDGFAVIVLNTIIPPTKEMKQEKIASFKELMLKQYRNDLLTAYLNALKIRYPVKLNQAAFAAFAGQ